MRLFVIVSLLALHGMSLAQDIKGIHIGMSKAEYNDAIGNAREWTVAQTPSKYSSGPNAVFDKEGTLQHFLFFFPSSSWEHVRDAVLDKYPKLRCETSPVQNRFGASFAQEECSFGNLKMSRFVSDIETSSLSLWNPEFIRKLEEERKKTQKPDV